MLSYSARVTWQSEDSAIVVAQSKLCRYRIVIDSASVSLTGPGLEMTLDREEDLPEFESFEALAISAILQLEEGK